MEQQEVMLHIKPTDPSNRLVYAYDGVNQETSVLYHISSKNSVQK